MKCLIVIMLLTLSLHGQAQGKTTNCSLNGSSLNNVLIYWDEFPKQGDILYTGPGYSEYYLDIKFNQSASGTITAIPNNHLKLILNQDYYQPRGDGSVKKINTIIFDEKTRKQQNYSLVCVGSNPGSAGNFYN